MSFQARKIIYCLKLDQGEKTKQGIFVDPIKIEIWSDTYKLCPFKQEKLFIA